MAFVESAVVVYLREIYYPGGFRFPLKVMSDKMIAVELLRELSTLFMLTSVAALAGRKFWERFAHFLLLFGIWDIFYYIWLKVLIGWPSSPLEWDILFLIPIPWISPVIAPVSVALLMILGGALITYSIAKRNSFKPGSTSYILTFAGAAMILYSFMRDTDATLHQRLPGPYRYEFLILGDVLFAAAFAVSYVKVMRRN
ncbi:MAG: hypothetical protein HZC13_05830, partial [Nitrospirae bacterium]|nr:hypothetical protein [Nitrospirota bacterium]